MKGRIIGIDPGTNVLGYAILQVDGKKADVVVMGVVEMKGMEDHYAKLKRIQEKVTVIMDTYKPDVLAIEAPFFGKNVQSMLKLGRAQGVCMGVACAHNIPIHEYAPLRIKQCITGQGAASKEHVATVLQRLLHFDDIPKYLDATDAMAAAYCHFVQSQVPAALTKMPAAAKKVASAKKSSRTSSKDAWSKFIAQNPDRISKK
ncbi:MAG: crossover junction endodeoxyribonuclease RuvC [Bacteroidales bacterium]|nr:crossover junction endodeoxyribonuclease RuvC [Bacteroidales bacterium]